MHSTIKPIRSEKQPSRAGNAMTCANCGASLQPKRGSRRQRYCDDACRKTAFRAAKWLARYEVPEAGRSVEILPAISTAIPPDFADRPPRIYGPRNVIEAEVFGGRQWREIVSANGVRAFVTDMRVRR